MIFVNIMGIIHDMLEGNSSVFSKKMYLNSTLGVISMIFFRSFIFVLKGIFSFKLKDFLTSISIVLFILSIYYLFQIQTESIKGNFKIWSILSFIIWSIIYAYLSITSKFLYEGKELTKLSEREMKIYSNNANSIDKIILFFQNIIYSFFSPNIYILSIITTLYLFLTSKFI